VCLYLALFPRYSDSIVENRPVFLLHVIG